MADADIKVEMRERVGHHTAKVLRRGGRIPAVFYAPGEDTQLIHMDYLEIKRLLQREVNIINVVFPDGKARKSIFREVQRDPVTEEIIHVDLLGIKLTEKIRLSIPILLRGTPLGVKEGGILEHLLREVTVEGLPLDIPEHLEVDVSDLNIGDVVTLEQIEIGDKIRFVTEIHHAVANVIHPKIVKEAVVEEEVLAEEEAAGAEEAEGGAAEESEESKESS
jgi:large subunit ribosomal protein L25